MLWETISLAPNHDIKRRQKQLKTSANNRVVCNHAKDISDTATGYFMNSPISYSSYDNADKSTVDKLKEVFDKAYSYIEQYY